MRIICVKMKGVFADCYSAVMQNNFLLEGFVYPYDFGGNIIYWRQ